LYYTYIHTICAIYLVRITLFSQNTSFKPLLREIEYLYYTHIHTICIIYLVRIVIFSQYNSLKSLYYGRLITAFMVRSCIMVAASRLQRPSAAPLARKGEVSCKVVLFSCIIKILLPKCLFEITTMGDFILHYTYNHTICVIFLLELHYSPEIPIYNGRLDVKLIFYFYNTDISYLYCISYTYNMSQSITDTQLFDFYTTQGWIPRGRRNPLIGIKNTCTISVNNLDAFLPTKCAVCREIPKYKDALCTDCNHHYCKFVWILG